MTGFAIASVAFAVLSIGLAALLALSLARAGRVTRRFQALEDIAVASDAATSLEEALEAINRALVPAVADFATIDVISAGEVRRAAVRVGAGAPAGVEEGLAGRRPSLPSGIVGGSGAVEPRFFERLSEADLRDLADSEADLAFLRGIGVGSAITIALRARGRVMGALTLGVAWSGRRYRPADARFVRVLAGRAALALDNAGLFSDLGRSEQARAEIAETLQRGLLPPPLPHIPGWSAAAMYRPAGAENEVGGDFYDAFPFAGGWMIVIGDVTGRGARAASITGQARYILRTAAMLTGDPLVALSTLNRALLVRHDSALCSIAAFALSEDPAEPVRLAVAGHPPPLLVDGEAVSETVSPGPLLGAFPNASWTLERALVAPGQQLVVITDGITEARGEGGRFGEARLRSELAGASSPSLAVQRLERALHDFTAGRLDDDAAILAIARARGESGESTYLSADAVQPLATA